MKIVTINVQNKYKIKKFAGKEEMKKVADEINDVDIACVQELTSRMRNNLILSLGEEYDVVGSPRLGNSIFTRKIELLNSVNEYNSIISKYKIIKHKTVHLSLFPSAFPRIFTEATIDVDGVIYRIINLHLEHRNKKIRSKQFDKLLSSLKRMNKDNPVIITGDFNSTLKNKDFLSFIETVKELGFTRVENNIPTHKSEKVLDHIFYSSNLKLIKKRVFINDYSDHNSLYAEFEYIKD